MIRCVHLWTDSSDNSRHEEGFLEFGSGPHGDAATGKLAVKNASFEETASGGSLDWHTAPARQFVVTLSGTLEFLTRGGERFILRPGEILFAEDTAGGGHSWKLIDDQPWRRLYVVLNPDTKVPFKATAAAAASSAP
jgi:quercetin dioxygenase-like cupin family protein